MIRDAAKLLIAGGFRHICEMSEQALTAKDFLKLVEPRFGSDEAARAWFEGVPLPGFSGATAQQLLAAGRASDVLDYVSAVDAGVYS